MQGFTNKENAQALQSLHTSKKKVNSKISELKYELIEIENAMIDIIIRSNKKSFVKTNQVLKVNDSLAGGL